MKKKIALLLAALMLCSVSVFAAPQTIDLDTMTIDELEELIADATAKINALTPKPAPAFRKTFDNTHESSFYNTHEKGSKGDEVKAIQNRLIELKYMTGTADGSYGNMTAQAVTDYQKVEGLKFTGVADSKTQVKQIIAGSYGRFREGALFHVRKKVSIKLSDRLKF